jgi:hypothetical protein
MSERVLSALELNRATLARQMLLKRERLDPVAAIERLVALQAQEPASPYIALWTRVSGFRAEALDRAFHERRVVKGTLMRVTLHAASAHDYAHFWPAVAPSLRLWRQRILGRLKLEVDLDELADRALAFASEPRSGAELRGHLPPLGGAGPTGQQDAFWAVRPHVPFVMAPGEIPWSFGRRPMFVAARSWLSGSLAAEEAGLDHLVRRYLRGFGPATIGDISQFTAIERSRLKPALERLGPELRFFRDERKRLLYDLPDAPLPTARTRPPVRFLPMWDSVLLAYEDRGRILPEAHRRRVIQKNGDFLPTFLVDGHVAGLWRSEVSAEGRTSIRWEPFEKLAPGVEDRLAREAARLAAFVQPLEPAVYKRYATTWMKQV